MLNKIAKSIDIDGTRELYGFLSIDPKNEVYLKYIKDIITIDSSRIKISEINNLSNAEIISLD